MPSYPQVSLAFLCVMAMASIMPQRSEAQRTQKSFLLPHNVARRNVGIGPIVWDTTVEAFAREYANKRKGDCKLKHSGTSYGENLFYESYGGRYNAVRSWVEEKKWYNHTSNSCINGETCKDYTQVVWNASVKVGCAAVTCDKRRGRFVICNYDPSGNIEGESPYVYLN